MFVKFDAQPFLTDILPCRKSGQAIDDHGKCRGTGAGFAAHAAKPFAQPCRSGRPDSEQIPNRLTLKDERIHLRIQVSVR